MLGNAEQADREAHGGFGGGGAFDIAAALGMTGPSNPSVNLNFGNANYNPFDPTGFQVGINPEMGGSPFHQQQNIQQEMLNSLGFQGGNQFLESIFGGSFYPSTDISSGQFGFQGQVNPALMPARMLSMALGVPPSGNPLTKLAGEFGNIDIGSFMPAEVFAGMMGKGNPQPEEGFGTLLSNAFTTRGPSVASGGNFINPLFGGGAGASGQNQTDFSSMGGTKTTSTPIGAPKSDVDVSRIIDQTLLVAGSGKTGLKEAKFNQQKQLDRLSRR